MPVHYLPEPEPINEHPIELPDIQIPKKRSGILSRLFTVSLAAFITASCGLRFGDILALSMLPDGYIFAPEPEAAPFSALTDIGRLLPVSRPDIDAAGGSDKQITQPASDIPEGDLRIVEYDFSGIGLSNETDYLPDLDALLQAPLPFMASTLTAQSASSDAPTVLIIHTHGSEAYAADGALSYPADSGMRSYDITQNVVAVGTAVANRLESAGIGVIHLTEMFDAESYYNSYNRSLEAVRSCLEDFPSVRFIIDLHRDASADTARGIAYKPVTTIGGEKHAQLMLVVGTDHLGASHPDWEQNLSAALKLQKLLSDISPSLVRPINLRGASFNQQYSPGFLLLEVGSCSNTLDEAKRSGILFADCLAELIESMK